MRALGTSVAIAVVLLLLTGGRLIFVLLLFVPLGLLNSRRVRESVAHLRARHSPSGRTNPQSRQHVTQ